MTLWKHFKKMAWDLGTGPDGITWALGRIMGWMMFFAGTPIPVAIIGWVMWKGPAPTLAEWGGFLGPVAAYEAGVVAAITALVRLTNSTEPPAPPTT